MECSRLVDARYMSNMPRGMFVAQDNDDDDNDAEIASNDIAASDD